jgi:hypothetical protein
MMDDFIRCAMRQASLAPRLETPLRRLTTFWKWCSIILQMRCCLRSRRVKSALRGAIWLVFTTLPFNIQHHVEYIQENDAKYEKVDDTKTFISRIKISQC